MEFVLQHSEVWVECRIWSHGISCPPGVQTASCLRRCSSAGNSLSKGKTEIFPPLQGGKSNSKLWNLGRPELFDIQPTKKGFTIRQLPRMSGKVWDLSRRPWFFAYIFFFFANTVRLCSGRFSVSGLVGVQSKNGQGKRGQVLYCGGAIGWCLVPLNVSVYRKFLHKQIG